MIPCHYIAHCFITYYLPPYIVGTVGLELWTYNLQSPCFFTIFDNLGHNAARTRLQVLQNSESWIFMFRVYALSVQDSHCEIREKKLYRVQQHKACVQSIDWLSAVQKGRGAAKSFNRKTKTHVVQLTATCLDHQATSWYCSTGKNP